LVTGLWRIGLCKDTQQITIAAANNVHELCNTGELVNYLHKAMLIPTKSALIKAVKQGYLQLGRVSWKILMSFICASVINHAITKVMGQ
jgi:hypothetical protein